MDLRNSLSEICIELVNESLREAIQHKLNNKTKPLGSLGEIECIALRISMIQNTLTPVLIKPHAFIFAGDHGICEEGVSAFPQAVTQQMVANFLAGGAAISALAQQHEISLGIVDAGINADVSDLDGLQQHKVGFGTCNFTQDLAMPVDHVMKAVKTGADVIKKTASERGNIVLLGEMGIGNTTSAAIITHLITGAHLDECVGAGTGLDAQGVQHKVTVIKKALKFHESLLAEAKSDAVLLLSVFGGYEIAMMVGAYLQAASQKMVVLVDGVIATAALAVANLINPLVLEYCIFSHGSAEQGHGALLNYFNRKPILNLQMRLGEGSGSAMAYPLLVSAVNLLNSMASFSEAGVSESDSAS